MHKPIFVFQWSVVLFALLLLIPISANAEVSELVFTPRDDTYVENTFPTTSFGTRTTLEIDNDSPTGAQITYLAFEVSGLCQSLQECRVIRSVKLRMWCSDAGEGCNVFTTSSTWRESSVNWNNKPTDYQQVGSFPARPSGSWVESTSLGSAVTGNGVVSFAVILPAGSGDGSSYHSKENPSGKAPELVVEIDPVKDNGQACTQDRQCASWNCVDGFCCGATNCDDDNACTVDSCSTGSCTHEPAGTDVVCRVAAHECDAAETCTAEGTCPADLPAPLGTACTDDDNACTDDICNGAGACTHPAAERFCFIGNTCIADGQSKLGNPCQICDPDQSTTAWSNVPNYSTGGTCFPCSSGEPGVGICQSGTNWCVSGQLSGSCDGFVCPTTDKCDEIDNDCDGSTDEDYDRKGEECTVGRGICERTGTYICSNDGNGTSCDAVAGQGVNELCDELDNDCDGRTDENWPGLGDACEVGEGFCTAEGIMVCNEDGNGAFCEAGEPTGVQEFCDGLDNDCDGLTDEPEDIALVCDDGNECTIDGCHPPEGCTYDNLPDETPCTGDGSAPHACIRGECVPFSANGTCSQAVVLTVDQPFDDFFDTPNSYQSIPGDCHSIGMPGPDSFFRVSLEANRTYTITATPQEGLDLGIALLSECQQFGGECIESFDKANAGEPETKVYVPMEDTDLVIRVLAMFVDSPGAEGDFQILVSVEPLPDGDEDAEPDLPADGDDIPDGDEVVDGDETDGDAPVVDGDDVIVTDGDTTTDGDFTDGDDTGVVPGSDGGGGCGSIPAAPIALITMLLVAILRRRVTR